MEDYTSLYGARKFRRQALYNILEGLSLFLISVFLLRNNIFEFEKLIFSLQIIVCLPIFLLSLPLIFFGFLDFCKAMIDIVAIENRAIVAQKIRDETRRIEEGKMRKMIREIEEEFPIYFPTRLRRGDK